MGLKLLLTKAIIDVLTFLTGSGGSALPFTVDYASLADKLPQLASDPFR